MWTQAVLLLPVLLASSAHAQQILQFGSGNLPTCAQNCVPLNQAQTACVAVPSTEKSCFCQSAYLTQQANLFANANAVCTDVCTSQSDRNQIQSWYKNYCSGSNPQAAAPVASTTSAPSPVSTTPVASATASSGGSRPFQIQSTDSPSWWSQHGKWIAMVIVLVVAFTIIIVVGVMWKKRHDRKVNRAADTPLPDGWGPPPDPHTYGATGEKLQGSVRTGTAPRRDNPASDAEKGSSRRLKKLIGR